jgi:hypothetical protein
MMDGSNLRLTILAGVICMAAPAFAFQDANQHGTGSKAGQKAGREIWHQVCEATPKSLSQYSQDTVEYWGEVGHIALVEIAAWRDDAVATPDLRQSYRILRPTVWRTWCPCGHALDDGGKDQPSRSGSQARSTH